MYIVWNDYVNIGFDWFLLIGFEGNCDIYKIKLKICWDY